jgi:hypothetical protein
MGLISTDRDDPPYVGFTPAQLLDWTVPNPVGVFQAAVRQLGTSGDSTERSYEPLQKSLSQYPGFIRKDSILALIIVTDAYEQSDMLTSQLVDFLKSFKAVDQTMVYGILGPQDFGCPNSGGEDEWDYAGSKYEELINAYNGKHYPLCTGDYSAMLADIAQNLVNRVVASSVYLESRPLPDTIRVYYQGRLIPGGLARDGGFWTYDPQRNSLVFHDLSFAPGDDESVQIDYQPDEGFPPESKAFDR